ncbi:hypothetical protein [Nocardioides albus]|uniref:Uncharacterized protein n=1 Tax=Nocardioides albus TaxID=1841 RepID=A0A7W5A3M9_9ACTN|nr:hypothetical protein [Nocardioides albus]MBB3088890.1 hypothetical protein [Nocardioides albus]GGU19426.1 hypothetical protein GCM10007979_17810 [Nocardioides albus]
MRDPVALWRRSSADRLKAYAVEYPPDATDDEQRDRVRMLLNLLRPYGSEFQTDMSAVVEVPPEVVDSRAFLRSLKGTKVGSEDYATTNLVDSADDRLWESFVQVAPYAFSAEFWQGSRYLVSLADECQSVVVYLVPGSDLHAAVADRFDIRLLD